MSGDNFERHELGDGWYMNTVTPDDLRNGTSWYDGENTVYFRGDGVNTTVILPEGKARAMVSGYPGKNSNPPGVVEFDHAIPSGELVTITLRDAE